MPITAQALVDLDMHRSHMAETACRLAGAERVRGTAEEENGSLANIPSADALGEGWRLLCS